MKYLIHIGYPKAASTLLQSTLFSGQDKYIKPLKIDGEEKVQYQKSGGRLFHNLDQNGTFFLNPLVFDKNKAKTAILSSLNEKALVTSLSNEAWAGHPYSGGVTAKEYAERFHKTLPDAKILLIVRNQVDMIFSAYVQYIVDSKGHGSLKKFLVSPRHLQVPFHNLTYYCYHSLVEHYVGLFGKENVLVVPFEILVNDGQEKFFEEVYDFVDVPVESNIHSLEANKTEYDAYVILRLFPFLNLFTRGGPIHGFEAIGVLSIRDVLLKFFRKLVSQKLVKKAIQKDKALIKKYINTEIRTSNEKLQQYIDKDLQSLGYLFNETPNVKS